MITVKTKKELENLKKKLGRTAKSCSDSGKKEMAEIVLAVRERKGES